MGMTLQRLREQHTDMARLLDAFERQLEIFEEAGTPDYDIIDGVVEYCLIYPDLHIHPKEERILGALLVRDPRRAAEVDSLREQHRELAALVRRLAAAVRYVRLDAALSREHFSALARDLLVLYRRHMDAERHLLFTDAARTLTPADWAAIDWQTSRPPAPVVSAEIDRLELLRNCILTWDTGR